MPRCPALLLNALVAAVTGFSASALAGPHPAGPDHDSLRSLPSAAWKLAAENGSTAWAVHTGSRRRSGDEVTFWVLTNYKTPFVFNGKPGRSSRGLWRISCGGGGSFTWFVHHYHAGYAAAGAALGSDTPEFPTRAPIAPGSMADELRKAVCT